MSCTPMQQQSTLKLRIEPLNGDPPRFYGDHLSLVEKPLQEAHSNPHKTEAALSHDVLSTTPRNPENLSLKALILGSEPWILNQAALASLLTPASHPYGFHCLD